MNKIAVAVDNKTWAELKKSFAEIIADRLDEEKVTHVGYKQYYIMYWNNDEDPKELYSEELWGEFIKFFYSRKHAILNIGPDMVCKDTLIEDSRGVDKTFENLLKYKTEIYVDLNGSMKVVV